VGTCLTLVVLSLSTYSNMIQLGAHTAQEDLGLLLWHFLPPMMTLARCTRRTGAMEERTNRPIFCLSSSDSSLKPGFFGISSPNHPVVYGEEMPHSHAEKTS
jgi:hypothetical protein